jgi:pyruvate formate lyase activating enzyme
MAKCRLCGKDSLLISSFLGVCVDCIRNDFELASSYIQPAHSQARKRFNLPLGIPKDSGGRRCNLCVNACQVNPVRNHISNGVKPDSVGFCGLPIDTRKEASLAYYYDPLPTNCVADWVCAGSYDRGYNNLAVFYNACSFDCLFCQNWHFKEANLTKRISARELASRVDEKAACICYFGGDPTPQLPHSIEASRLALKLNKNRPLRICWETNGSMSSQYLKEMLDISLQSGGCIKFDLKAWTEELNIALCGTSNRQTLENFKFISSYINKRPNPPLLVASTLLVPGYVDIYEVERLAEFISSLSPLIPYSLLAFHPQFYMDDLPTTSRSHAERAKQVAEKAGLKNVRIGNIHLLRDDYVV